MFNDNISSIILSTYVIQSKDSVRAGLIIYANYAATD